MFDIDARGARNAAVLHGSISAGILALGAVTWILPASAFDDPEGARVALSTLAFLGASLFAWIGGQFFLRLRSDAPLFGLHPRGIYDNGSAVFSGVGWIAWSEVADIRVGRYHNLACVEVVLVDRDAFLQRVPWIERPGRSAWLGYPAVAFRGPLLPGDPKQIVEQARAYARRRGVGLS